MSYSLVNFDIQGHRGCRGWLPENSIPGFIRAVQLGATTLEMDVVVTGDRNILVSHEPFMSHEICLTPTGAPIGKYEERNHNIFEMDTRSIQKYDCGSLGNPFFKDQLKVSVHKPLLSDVIDAVEKHVEERKLTPVNYNIEIKSTPDGDGIFHPAPELFSDLVVAVVHSKSIMERTTIQSFDSRILQHLKYRKENVKLSLLIENLKSCQSNIDLLGFTPDVYSPHFKLITAADVKTIHHHGLKVIPWTVNHEVDFLHLIGLGVDGIITDYPDRLRKVVTN